MVFSGHDGNEEKNDMNKILYVRHIVEEKVGYTICHKDVVEQKYKVVQNGSHQ